MENNLNFNPNGFNSFGMNNNLQNSFSNNYSGINYNDNDNNYNQMIDNNDFENDNQSYQSYQSLDGRTWETKSEEFAANKQYYQKMLDESRKSN